MNGYGSYLFLTLIDEWFRAHPTGRLYLGRQVACVDPATYKRGNHLYRRKLRATTGPGTAFQVRVAQPQRVSTASDPALAGVSGRQVMMPMKNSTSSRTRMKTMAASKISPRSMAV